MKYVLIIYLMLIAFAPSWAFSAVPNSPVGRAAGLDTTCTSSGTIINYRSPDLSKFFGKNTCYQSLGGYIADLVRVAMVIAAVAATLMVVYAGFEYLNSGGSPEITAKAKEMIIGALLGLLTIFVMGAFLISLYSQETLDILRTSSNNSTNSQSSPANLNNQGNPAGAF
ncbi:hypothetical protein HY065_00970 [Candidatus Berkelbacteria bacterium]|nr:hypothetical protein [Candidatus Berkelbacteria bacterium]